MQKWNNDRQLGPLCPWREDYPVFFAASQKGGKNNSGEYEFLNDHQGRLYDLHSHPMVDHDLFNLHRYLADQCAQRLNAARNDTERDAITKAYEEKRPFVPERPGIADAFREWGKKQGLAFCQEEAE